MQNRQVVLLLEAICILWMIGAAPLPGQIQRSPGELALNQMAAKGTMIPAGQASFELPFIFDPSADGGEWLHVYRSAESTTVTLRNPGGTIIDAETAAGMGFAWREWTIAITADLDLDAGDDLGLVPGGIGTHMIIQFPGGQPAGTYTLVFDAGSTTVQTVVTVEFWTNSPVAAGVRTDARSYRTGDPVSVIAVVANGGDPVAGATVTGYALPTRDVTESVSVGEAVLLDKSDLGSGMSHYRYRIRLHNNTQSSVWRFAARAESFEENVRVVLAVLGFPPMPPGTSLLSEDSISVAAPTTPEFNPNSLDWETTAKSQPISLSLADVSVANGVAGDGVYGAVFQPAESGEYSISLEITGATPLGTPFYRNAATSFMVVQAQATVAAITAEGIDANNNQKYEALRFNVSIDVQEPGEYTLSFQIKDTAEHSHTFLRTASLTAGANQIALDVEAKDLLAAGFTNSPLSITGVTLRRDVFGRNTVVDYHATMGVTPAYNLGDFERGSIYFTGQTAEQALNLDGQSGYDVLRVQAEVEQGPGVSERTMQCRVQGKLTDAAGFVVDAVTGEAEVREGTNWVAMDFRGPRIARSNVNGPYSVRDVSIDCTGIRDFSGALLTTASYLAGDFANVPPEFAIDLSGISIKPGETRHVALTIRGLGGYEGIVTLSAPSASAGLTPVVSDPQILVDSLTTTQLSADAGMTPGSYSMQLSATDGTITRTAEVPVLVTSQDLAVTLTRTGPWRLHPGMSTQLTATVQNAAQQDVIWSADPGVGTFVVNGNTATYTLGALTEAGSDSIQARSVADPTRTGEQLFDLQPPVLIALTPATTVLRAGQVTSVSAQLTNNSNRYDPALTWTVTPYPNPGGMVAPQALKLWYQAPSSVSSPQTVSIEARFEEDPAALGVTTLTVLPDIKVQITPISKGLRASETQVFAATVLHDPSNAGVTWTLSPSVGSVDANGLYTAPASIASQQTVTVKATSVADTTKAASATVTLLPALSIVVGVEPVAASLRQGQTQQFTATVTNATNAGVTWAVSPSVGTVNASGLYTAPSSIASQQIVTVTATSVEDGTKAASATVTLLPPVTVSVSPTSATLRQGQTQQFTATVTNATNAGVTWMVSPSVGSVDANGLYTAPASIASQQTITVTATSVEDATKAASATVTLRPPVTVSVSPTTASLSGGGTRQFTATVTNATNTAVTWAVSPSVGSVNASGMYTAPSSIASQQTVTVTATSVEDGTRSASATVTLQPPVTVSVSPTSATLRQGQTQQFAATVTNATNSGVTWARNPGVGSVSASGLYTAPSLIATQQTVTVTATSVEDSSKAASAAVTLLPPANAKPSIQGATPSNGAGWATVFKYEFSDSNGAEDIVTAEVSYSTGSTAPFANSCWFVYSKSTNAVRLYNNAGTGFVSGQIVADTSGGNLSNARCSLVGGSLKVYPGGNTLTIFLGIGFTTGTARNYTARLKATDAAGAVAGFSPYGAWTVPAATAPPSSPAASGSGSPSAMLTVSLVDTNNTSLDAVDIDDIQTLVTKTGGGTDSCRFYYFAPAEMIVLMDDDDVHWAGVSKAGGGGGAISNSKCMVNAAAAQKTYDSNTKRFGITVPVTAHGAFTGTKYVYVGGSDLSGNIASPSWVHSWTTN